MECGMCTAIWSEKGKKRTKVDKRWMNWMVKLRKDVTSLRAFDCWDLKCAKCTLEMPISWRKMCEMENTT